MQFAELKPFFRDHTVWRLGHELYWYELMWEALVSNKALNDRMKEYKQESSLLAIALVDLYREFVQHAQDEYWSEGELNTINLKDCDYDLMCRALNIPVETIHDFYSEEDILIEGWDEEDIQDILSEERPSMAELYFTHGADRYRNRILSVIKQKYSLADLFSLMTNTFASDRYSRHRYLEDDDYQEVSIVDTASFIRSAESNQDDFLDDMDFIRGFGWLAMVY